MYNNFYRVFSGVDSVTVLIDHSFSQILPKGTGIDVRQTHATARHNKDNREIICDIVFVNL